MKYTQAHAKETVVLLHGTLSNGIWMRPLENHLQKAGYNTINIDYPYRRMPLEQLAFFMSLRLRPAPAFNSAAKIHFVAHSMGGLVTRYFLHRYRPPHLGRVVMLGTPNRGSEFADFYSKAPVLRSFFKKLCGPAGVQMTTDFRHAVREPVDFPLGIIAGNAYVNPLSLFILGKKGSHDGMVSLERMKIP